MEKSLVSPGQQSGLFFFINSGFRYRVIVSHPIRIEKPEDADQQLINWLKQAYEQAG